MRLAVVSPFVDRRHGTERALAELLERLAANERCEIHLYAEYVEDLEVSLSNGRGSTEPGAIQWHRIPSVPGPHFLKFLVWLFLNSINRRWNRQVHGVQFDLVLSAGINCLDADVILVHVLFHRLRDLSQNGEKDSTKPGLLRWLHRRIYYGLLARLERHIYANPRVSLAAVSQRTATQLKDYFGRQDACVILNGVDTKQFCPPARLRLRTDARQRRKFQENDFVLLLIGNDWRVKGLDTVLRAMAALSQLPLQIVVVGDDSHEFFSDTAKSLGLHERCRFESSSKDVLDFYAAADVYVSPSREDSFGLPVAEAMACGLPVITSTHAGIADLIRDGIDGFVLSRCDDSQGLARILERLYSDESFRARVANEAAKSASQWTWDRNADEVWELLLKAVEKKARLSPENQRAHSAKSQ